MLAPVAQGVPLSAMDEGQSAPFFMVLCKAMQSGSDRAADSRPDTDLSECPVCLGFAFTGSLLSPIASDYLLADLRPLAFGIEKDADARSERLSFGRQARAPPQQA